MRGIAARKGNASHEIADCPTAWPRTFLYAAMRVLMVRERDLSCHQKKQGMEDARDLALEWQVVVKKEA